MPSDSIRSRLRAITNWTNWSVTRHAQRATLRKLKCLRSGVPLGHLKMLPLPINAKLPSTKPPLFIHDEIAISHIAKPPTLELIPASVIVSVKLPATCWRNNLNMEGRERSNRACCNEGKKIYHTLRIDFVFSYFQLKLSIELGTNYDLCLIE